jgi:hypothetical protein
VAGRQPTVQFRRRHRTYISGVLTTPTPRPPATGVIANGSAVSNDHRHGPRLQTANPVPGPGRAAGQHGGANNTLVQPGVTNAVGGREPARSLPPPPRRRPSHRRPSTPGASQVVSSRSMAARRCSSSPIRNNISGVLTDGHTASPADRRRSPTALAFPRRITDERSGDVKRTTPVGWPGGEPRRARAATQHAGPARRLRTRSGSSSGTIREHHQAETQTITTAGPVNARRRVRSSSAQSAPPRRRISSVTPPSTINGLQSPAKQRTARRARSVCRCRA